MEDAQHDRVSDDEKPDRLTDEIRPPPFPFNLESTWVLAIVWLLLSASNFYVQHQLESYLGLGHILLKASTTLACAAAAAIVYDGVLTFVNEKRVWATREIEFTLASLVARHWRIVLDEDAALEAQKKALMQAGTLQVPRTVFGVTSELGIWALDCALVLVYHISFWQVLAGLLWILRALRGLPDVLVNAALLAALLMCGRFLHLRNTYDKVELTVASSLKGFLGFLKLPVSLDTTKQLTRLLFSAVLTATSWALPTDIIVPFTGQDVTKWAGHVDALKSFIYEKMGTLFSPTFDESWSSAGQLGAQVLLQLGLAAVCFLFVLGYHYLCQEQIVRTWDEVQRGAMNPRDVGDDERYVAAFWRAIALHLISFTAYQIFGAIVSAFELEPLFRLKASPTLNTWGYVLRSRHTLAAAAVWVVSRGLAALATGFCIYAIHYILRQITWLFIRILAAMVMFEDTVMWCSSLTQAALVDWKGHILHIASMDFKLKDKVLLTQGMMNFLFDIRAPLIIVPPNVGIMALDPEVWAG
ncbi:hypothetical protein PG997_003578 [Apiospora hydei]|uniref:Uncharacterized protein n=1 Tax=Apiospora hydei TaxID=1337664 RepID=A0ABR1WZP5_9PEZI